MGVDVGGSDKKSTWVNEVFIKIKRKRISEGKLENSFPFKKCKENSQRH